MHIEFSSLLPLSSEEISFFLFFQIIIPYIVNAGSFWSKDRNKILEDLFVKLVSKNKYNEIKKLNNSGIYVNKKKKREGDSVLNSH